MSSSSMTPYQFFHLSFMNPYEAALVLQAIPLPDRLPLISATDPFESPLWAACGSGYVPLVRLLLESGCSVSNLSTAQTSPLHVASEKGHTEVIQLLLDHGVSVHCRLKKGETALHRALLHNQHAAVKLLIAAGAEVNALTSTSGSPLSLACSKGQKRIVSLLLAAGADPNLDQAWAMPHTPLLESARNGRAHLVEKLLAAGADIMARSLMRSTPLHVASGPRVAQLLIAAGADLNVVEQGGDTPLHRAVYKKQNLVVKLLLDAGADPNIQNCYGETPADIAAKSDDPTATQYLAEYGGLTSITLAIHFLQQDTTELSPSSSTTSSSLLISSSRSTSFEDALLTELLSSTTKITSLSLNAFSPSGIELGKIIESNMQLRSLKITHPDCFSSSFLGMRDALQLNSTLTELHLNQDPAPNGDFLQLVAGLAKNNGLISLAMLNTDASFHVRTICRLLQANSTLTSLDLSENDFEPEQITELTNALQYNTTLTLLKSRHGTSRISKNMTLYDLLLPQIEISGLLKKNIKIVFN